VTRLDRIFGGHAPSRLRLVYAQCVPACRLLWRCRTSRRSHADFSSTKLRTWLVAGFRRVHQAQAPRVITATENRGRRHHVRFHVGASTCLKELGQAMVERGARAA